MSSSEKFCLKWNDFQENIVQAFSRLKHDSDFSDVTLVCEDDTQIEAHKLILTSCSPILRSMLKRCKHPHPLIYMRGIKSKDLNAIVDFIYHGEANIYQEDLDAFLALAEELQLKGLTGSNKSKSDEDNKSPPSSLRGQQYHPPDSEKISFNQKHNKSQDVKKEDHIGNMSVVETTLVQNAIVPLQSEKVTIANTENVKAQINSLMEKVSGGWKCTVCGAGPKFREHMARHIETHIEGISYTCSQCGNKFRSSHSLSNHMSTKHRNIV